MIKFDENQPEITIGVRQVMPQTLVVTTSTPEENNSIRVGDVLAVGANLLLTDKFPSMTFGPDSNEENMVSMDRIRRAFNSLRIDGDLTETTEHLAFDHYKYKVTITRD